MEHFDFMSQADLRKELEADLEEMNQCLQAQAWKGVHVLAGSIIEALIIDHLISENITKEANALKLTLDAALKVCQEKKVLQDKTIQLTSVIKSYRNLIHPGRVVRLEENASKEGADIAVALVKMVLKDITAVRMAKYGHTAEQVVRKLQSDASSQFIIEQLLARMHSAEIKRLLMVRLPERFVEAIGNDVGTDELKRYADCFHTGYARLEPHDQKEIAQWLAKIFREESQIVIATYPTYFLRCFYLDLLDEDDKILIKKHVIGQLDHNASDALLDSLDGLAALLEPEEAQAFLDPLMHIACRKDNQQASRLVEYAAFFNSNTEFHQAMLHRIQQWIDLFKESGTPEQVEKAEAIKADYELYSE